MLCPNERGVQFTSCLTDILTFDSKVGFKNPSCQQYTKGIGIAKYE